MLVEKILEMTNEEILEMVNEENYEYISERFSNLNNFCDIYQDGARLGGEDEYLEVNEYIELLKEND